MLTTLAMVLLVCTGGFISYYGDLQGRRWGKKRVSWFGMRPKHTAILITSLTGAGIALLTAIALMAVAPTLRAVVLQGERAINDNHHLELQKAQLNSQVEHLQSQAKQYAGLFATEQEQLQEVGRQLAKLKADSEAQKSLNEKLAISNGHLGQLNMRLQTQRAGLSRQNTDLTHKNARLAKDYSKGEQINKDLAQQNTQYSRDNSNLSKENAKLIATNGTLKDANVQLKADNDKLVSDNAIKKALSEAANKAYNDALDDTARAQEKNRQLANSNASLTIQRNALVQELDDVNSQLMGTRRDFLREYINLRQTRYNLRADTELARRTLDAHLSPKAVREELMALLKEASDRARRYGAVLGENGRAVVIVSKRLVTPASEQIANEDASVGAVVDAVAGSNTPVVIVARSLNNTSANEQVTVELTPYTSTTVFKPGVAVAARVVDSRQPIEKVVQDVILFLREDVRVAAIKAGTIPQISPDTGEQEVGMLDTPELIALVDRIRKTGGNVQLSVVANESITSGDMFTFGQSRGGAKPHNLRFDLKRVAGRVAQRAAPVSG